MTTPFTQLPQFVETEPVATAAGAFSLVFNTTLGTAKMLNWIPLSWEELGYIVLWFNTILAVGTYFQRSRVTPVEKANNRIKTAAKLPAGSKPPLIQ